MLKNIVEGLIVSIKDVFSLFSVIRNGLKTQTIFKLFHNRQFILSSLNLVFRVTSSMVLDVLLPLASLPVQSTKFFIHGMYDLIYCFYKNKYSLVENVKNSKTTCLLDNHEISQKGFLSFCFSFFDKINMKLSKYFFNERYFFKFRFFDYFTSFFFMPSILDNIQEKINSENKITSDAKNILCDLTFKGLSLGASLYHNYTKPYLSDFCSK